MQHVEIGIIAIIVLSVLVLGGMTAIFASVGFSWPRAFGAAIAVPVILAVLVGLGLLIAWSFGGCCK